MWAYYTILNTVAIVWAKTTKQSRCGNIGDLYMRQRNCWWLTAPCDRRVATFRFSVIFLHISDVSETKHLDHSLKCPVASTAISQKLKSAENVMNNLFICITFELHNSWYCWTSDLAHLTALFLAGMSTGEPKLAILPSVLCLHLLSG